MLTQITKHITKNCIDNKLRIKQLEQEIFKNNKISFKEMNLLPKELRNKLNEKFKNPLSLKLEKILEENDNIKLVLKTEDNYYIESVIMIYKKRLTICVSTQINCPIGCKFCATGNNKFVRNLTANEIVSQTIIANNLLFKKFKKNLTNIVVMGMGEPFLNYENLIAAIKIWTEKCGLGKRKIIISTVGIPDKILELSKFSKQIKLAISLHAPNDKLRTELIPINKRYPIKELFKTIIEFEKNTNKRISYEYVLINGINDTLKEAKELVQLLKRRKAFVDLIPFNEHQYTEFKRPERWRIERFYKYLKKHGIETSIRDSKGRKNRGACGQLVSKLIRKEKENTKKT